MGPSPLPSIRDARPRSQREAYFARISERGAAFHVRDLACRTCARHATDALRRVEGVRAAYGARLAAQKEGLQQLTRSTDWTVHLHRTDRPPQTVLLSLYLAMADLRRLTAA